MAAIGGHLASACFEHISPYISKTAVVSVMKLDGHYLHVKYYPHRCDVKVKNRIFGFLAYNSKAYRPNPSKLGRHEKPSTLY